MNPHNILQKLLQENIGKKIHSISKKSQKKKYDLLFSHTITYLIQSNTNDQIIQKILYLYSLYRNSMRTKSKKNIQHYIEKENELRKWIKNDTHKGGDTTLTNSFLTKDSIYRLYLTWINYQKQLFNTQTDIIKGGNSIFNISSLDAIASDLLFKLGVVYGSLLQFLKDVQDDIPKNEIDITGFVDDKNQLVSALKLTKYAATIISTIDSAVRVFVNQGNYDTRLLKPILNLIGVDFQNIEGKYQNVVECFQEIQNILEKKGFEKTFVNAKQTLSDTKSLLSDMHVLSSNAKNIASNAKVVTSDIFQMSDTKKQVV